MFISRSQTMQTLLARARRCARSSGTILITGESGTGKELLANYVHESDPRPNRLCTRVNCAAFHEGLAESELFGHEQGAFTGAGRRHDGFLEAAGDGTLFLDEIGELPLSTQAKLLRVLETGEYTRVGSTEVRHCKARIIAATNRDLASEVEAGRFRSDLFHRLEVLVLHLPSLSERRDEIPALVQHFLEIFGRENEVPVTQIADAVMKQLLHFDWPGNIRQLRNLIHRSCVDAENGVIERVDLPMCATIPFQPAAVSSFTADESGVSDLPEIFRTMSLDEIERLVILNRIQQFNGNKTEAAAQLGVTPRTLRNKIARWKELRKAG
jgi:DNA-binding NtrC family response regulator